MDERIERGVQMSWRPSSSSSGFGVHHLSGISEIDFRHPTYLHIPTASKLYEQVSHRAGLANEL